MRPVTRRRERAGSSVVQASSRRTVRGPERIRSALPATVWTVVVATSRGTGEGRREVDPGEGGDLLDGGLRVVGEVLVAQPQVAVGAAPQPARRAVPQVPLQRALGRGEPQHLGPRPAVGQGLGPRPRVRHGPGVAHDVEHAEVDAVEVLEHVAERRRLRGVDDERRTGHLLRGAVDRGQRVGQGVEPAHQAVADDAGREHPRQVARPHHAGVLGDERGRVDVGRAAEGLLDDRTPHRAALERLAAAAPPTLEEAPLPEEAHLAGGEDARRGAEDGVDERRAAAPEAGDEQHPRAVVAGRRTPARHGRATSSDRRPPRAPAGDGTRALAGDELGVQRLGLAPSPGPTSTWPARAPRAPRRRPAPRPGAPAAPPSAPW